MTHLKEAIERALSFLPAVDEKKDILKNTCQRIFQALRIDVNSEFEVLDRFFNNLPSAMAKGGRIEILTSVQERTDLLKKLLITI